MLGILLIAFYPSLPEPRFQYVKMSLEMASSYDGITVKGKDNRIFSVGKGDGVGKKWESCHIH